MVKQFLNRVSSRYFGSRHYRIKAFDVSQLQRFEVLLAKYGYSLLDFEEVFEFGCGNGRLISLYGEIKPNANFTGCDIDSKVLSAARRRSPNFNFELSKVQPPLPFDDESFDLVYSFSVFTHLTEETHIAWLKELNSKLKPGGIALYTTHSCECLKRMRVFSPGSIPKYGITGPLDDFISSFNDYHYATYPNGHPEYGLTLIPDRYIRDEWPKHSGMEVLGHDVGSIESYPEGCQDLVILRKPTE
jgi:SAM-dependent methyltransferase